MNMVRIETRKMTPVPRGSQMVFNTENLTSCGFDPAGKYVIVYEENKITIAKELKTAEAKVD
jgi:hypothetical protein